MWRPTLWAIKPLYRTKPSKNKKIRQGIQKLTYMHVRTAGI